MSANTRRIFISLTILISCISLQGQVLNDSLRVERDTITGVPIKKEKKGSIFAGRPGRSFLLSMILPGSGQIYNKSYLRVPFVYAAVGGAGWLLVHNTQLYNCRKARYISLVDGTPFNPSKNCSEADRLALITDLNRVKILRDNANKNRQTSIMIFSAVWLANGIDAFVDAHLKNFDIDDDLSFDIGLKNDADPFVPMRYGLFVTF